MFKKISLSLLIVCLSFAGFSKEIPSKPNPPRLVNDFAGVLSSQENEVLEQKLLRYEDSTSTQISIVIENSLDGDDAFEYSVRLGEAWGIGQKGKNNGLLIYVALQDRKVRIQTGYGLEATLTDAFTKRVIEEVIKPNFKQNNYYEGLNQATDYLIAKASGEFKSDGDQNKKAPKSKKVFIIFIIIMVVLYILSKFRGGGGRNYGSKGGMDWWTAAMIGGALGRSSGGSNWGSFSSGSGSFGGFGGGSFGGGGSGGDW